MRPIRQIVHLARRFFGHLRARPLSPTEQDAVRAALTDDLARLFFRQEPADQRHAFVVAHRVAERRPHDDAAFVAALLHDIGKAEARVGAIGRSVATVLDGLRFPLPARWRTYRDHGALGAAALVAAGAPGLAVAFARSHPGPPPPDVDPGTWADLEAADHV